MLDALFRLRLGWAIGGGLLGALTGIFGGPWAIFRTGLLAFLSLLALAVLEQFNCRRWWQYFPAGLLSGSLAAALVWLADLAFGPTDLKMPLFITLACCVAYGGGLLWCFNALRYHNKHLRWTGIIAVVWVINYLGMSPLFSLAPKLALEYLMLFTTAVFFALPWMYAAILINSTQYPDATNTSFTTYIYVLIAMLLMLPMGFLYLETPNYWFIYTNNNEEIKKQLYGYIDYGKYIIEPATKNKIPPPLREWKTPIYLDEADQKKAATLAGVPELKPRIQGYALSPDGKYIALTVKSNHELPYSLLLTVFKIGPPYEKGIFIERIYYHEIQWVAELPKEENEEDQSVR